jgi:hypothetical protein
MMVVISTSLVCVVYMSVRRISVEH